MKCFYLLPTLALLSHGSTSLVAQDTSCGIAWGPIINLSGENPFAGLPHIAVQGETVHVTWEGGGYRLPYRRSTDGGVTWEPTREMLSDTSVLVAYYPWLVANSRVLFFLFGKTTAQGQSPVCLMKSADGGTTWSAYDSINGQRTTQIWHVAISEDTLIVQYPRTNARFFVTTNGGVSWDSSLVSTRGRVEVRGGALHSVWGQPLNGQEVVYKRSTDLGQSWQDSIVLSTLDGEWSHDAKIAISAENPPRIYVTWRDTKYGCLTLVGCSIIMRQSGDSGFSWGDEYTMTDSPVGYNWDWGQQIATSGEKVIAVWTNDQTAHINMRYSVNRGGSWSPLCDVTPGRSTTAPSCAITPSAAHILWEDIDTSGTGGVHVYYRRGVILPSHVGQQPELPDQLFLLQNYPNPFNCQTRIEYWLEDREPESWVTLRVFNVLGQVVATLANERQREGRHGVTWDGSRVASGIYIYRLSVFKGALPTRTVSRTMVLLK